MCGRFSLATPEEILAEFFGLMEIPALTARYNIAPGQSVAAVGRRTAGTPPRLASLHWGFEAPPGPRRRSGLLINARSETVHRLPAFAESFRTRRCLIPADGFFEWKAEGGTKTPYHVRRRDGGLFALAGLWQTMPQRHAAGACVILTTRPNSLLAPLHDRMPVILSPRDFDRWLDPETRATEALRPLLRPSSAEEWSAVRVGRAVNNARHDGPDCILPVP